MKILETGTFIVALLTLIATIYYGRKQYIHAKMLKNDADKRYFESEKRNLDETYAKATIFIQKYSENNQDTHEAEVLLLPYCVAAYKYNPTFKYEREIYREYCLLTEDVQNEILKRRGINLKSEKVENYYSKILNIIFQNIAKRFPNNNIANSYYYDNGKYFEDVILHEGKSEIANLDDICILEDDKISLKEYIKERILDCKNGEPLSDILPYFKEGDYLKTGTICCLIAKYTIKCNYNELINTNEKAQTPDSENVNDYNGPKYMEDLFLETLHIVENYNPLDKTK